MGARPAVDPVALHGREGYAATGFMNAQQFSTVTYSYVTTVAVLMYK